MADTQKQAPLNAGFLFSCEGLVALVTGGGTGIGYMIADALLQNGASKVFIAGRRPEVLATAASTLGPRAVPVTCDVVSPESLRAAAAQVSSDAGRLDLLVCNAGVGGPQVAVPTAETSLEEWAAANLAVGFGDYARTFEVNTTAVWYTVMAFLPLLGLGNKLASVKQGSQVVVTSSIAGFNKTSPGGYAYGQSKAAVTLMVKQLAVMLPKWDIRVNAICPGLFPSEMSAPIVKRYQPEESSIPKTMIPLQRMGDEQDMAGAILYLASRAGAYCNGNVLIVDGGRLGNFPSTN
ncbi:related to gluconate 5-dehydrogenase [Cephalotrichum gorgonifer]|uniref:Related to gluconate 5-dehydrogenase n=1 Tax=Cephalotrichum gorgonifer TaxID=2041049 RepID=A0AAE8MSB9_9PEZI|nr:related to gluconate 5-dehydrogenase [Cephalotrichum gorgonifer]